MKNTILCLIILLSGMKYTMAQNSNRPVLNHIAVYVSNLEISSDFYRNVIGLDMIEEPFKDGRHTWFSIGKAGQLHLISGATKPMEQIKDRHLCFSVPSIENFIKNLEKNEIVFSNWKGDSKSPTVRPDGVKQIYFQDPDGYWIEINNDKP
jgi:lactoylglutathione lyase